MHLRFIPIFGLLALIASTTGCMTAFAAFQPEVGPTMVITTTDAEGVDHERVVTPIDDGDQLVVAADHWPRAWYERALANPNVTIRRDGETKDYTAVPVSEDERERLLDNSGFPTFAYLLTGFAPRQFLLLEPK